MSESLIQPLLEMLTRSQFQHLTTLTEKMTRKIEKMFIYSHDIIVEDVKITMHVSSRDQV